MVQSVAVGSDPLTTGYWPAMLPEARPRHALLLGLGGGTIAQLLLHRFGTLPITAIEKDETVVEIAYQTFALPREVEVVLADAFEHVFAIQRRFDYVAADIFERGTVPARLFSTPFLRQLKRLTEPGGLVTFNFFQDGRSTAHRHRLDRVFPRVEIVTSGKNLVARCRVR
ncbi:MAG: hypothetical protein A3F84_21985 [Candidatus Handelsmanbacteria bacterium RIFCSPLOWO2_12_FULL_64_10]|uniref:PABS domain-containing protein n=1 Tax=Handelsmanbacteria sp. (strain RIFCSPLOWO2_12_FULL_64_10) TaxID=1817868 RepID=A0A1F6CG49_HANXR|nr:MAG: hypothetical protein A3F84_21985 [Candidatus Handelsmanbacteria bacterium RIFCSPLOWO2_12_FULL_64_10]